MNRRKFGVILFNASTGIILVATVAIMATGSRFGNSMLVVMLLLLVFALAGLLLQWLPGKGR